MKHRKRHGHQDHPRVCGEKFWKLIPSAPRFGSPPRMRGKVTSAFFVESRTGITPAYAGKRTWPTPPTTAAQDHPRVCGEKRLQCCAGIRAFGSPPRMRGKVGQYVLLGSGFGITPAYAGKRSTDISTSDDNKDHPRVCGEKPNRIIWDHWKEGSPPRMRGKASYGWSASSVFRITPAYAGKRLKRSRSTVPPVAIVPLFPSVCNKPVVSDGSPAGRDAPLFLPAENAVPASPAYNLRSL